MLVKRIFQVWTGYIKGQLLLTVFVFGATYLASKILGLPYPGIMSLMAGVCENIPKVGPVFATFVAAVLGLILGSSVLELSNWLIALITVGVYILVQVIEDYLISPKIIGKTVQMNALVVFLLMTIGAFFFGVPGMLLAVPVAGSLREIYRYFFQHDVYFLPQPDEYEIEIEEK